ncbi:MULTISPECIES: hypothetical protein [Bacillaceae]|uniref:hypothetical protein n=1 Tax=Bacillaceae TaxID=186817 RepID=UPI001C571D71|nr:MULTISPECIES: hypothetical protein [Rossellomorea]MBW3113352.1 hypothetical protein [Bacillus sp. MCCB 382]MDX8345516.1 hypothetical protein [Rossellomorea sp. YZS02]
MINLFVKLIITFLLGYLFITWFPVTERLTEPEFIVELVLNPIQFFAASIAFMIGLLVQGNVLKTEIHSVIQLWNGRLHKELVIIPFHIGLIFALSVHGGWQTMIFSCSAFFYGIISIDFRRQGGHNA